MKQNRFELLSCIYAAVSDPNNTPETGLNFKNLLPIVIPAVIILILAVSALFLFKSIRRDTGLDKTDEQDKDSCPDEPLTPVMNKTTPIPSPCDLDHSILDYQIRNFVVSDVREYLEPETDSTKSQNETLAELEQELARVQKYERKLKKRIDKLKN